MGWWWKWGGTGVGGGGEEGQDPTILILPSEGLRSICGGRRIHYFNLQSQPAEKAKLFHNYIGGRAEREKDVFISHDSKSIGIAINGSFFMAHLLYLATWQ